MSLIKLALRVFREPWQAKMKVRDFLDNGIRTHPVPRKLRVHFNCFMHVQKNNITNIILVFLHIVIILSLLSGSGL